MKDISPFRMDLEKYYSVELGTTHPPLRKKAKMWLTHLGFHCVAVYRLGRFTHACRMRGNWLVLPLSLVYEVLCFFVKAFHHVDIYAASIGPGFYIGHVGTIYIGPCRIGANCSVTHNVTIGVGHAKGAQGLPTLGNDVWIGTGAIVFGKVKIGNGVTVNCGSVLSRSMPDRCLASGNPARIAMRNHDNAKMFAFFRVLTAPAPGPLILEAADVHMASLRQ
jgi:serine O-acetyltransferase